MNASAGAREGIAAVVLAAGRSTRMGGTNKLTTTVDGRAMVRHPIEAARATGIDPVVVVLGHDADAIEAALVDLPVRCVRNARFVDGLSTSVAAGIGALPPSTRAVVMMLGDMPRVNDAHLSRLIAAYDADPRDEAICVAAFRGRRGNPVLWGRGHFAAMQTLKGDAGARGLMTAHAAKVREVEMPDDGIMFDVDTPEALRVLGEKRAVS